MACAWVTEQTLSTIAAKIPTIERIMNTSTSRFWQTGSLTAGALIGLSMVGMVFAMTEVDAASDLPILLALGSLVVLVVGLVIQIGMTATPGERPTSL